MHKINFFKYSQQDIVDIIHFFARNLGSKTALRNFSVGNGGNAVKINFLLWKASNFG